MSKGTERHHQRLRSRERTFGWYHLMVGIAAIPARLLFGSNVGLTGQKIDGS